MPKNKYDEFDQYLLPGEPGKLDNVHMFAGASNTEKRTKNRDLLNFKSLQEKECSFCKNLRENYG